MPWSARRSHPQLWMPVVVFVFLMVFAGGGHPLWSRGIAVTAIGGFMIWRPPLLSPGRWVDRWVLVTIGVFCLSLLPLAEVFPAEWHDRAGSLGILLPTTLAPHPWESVEWIVLFIAVFGWLYTLCAFPVVHADRKRVMRFFAWGGAILGATAATATLLGMNNPFAPDVHNFSYFPNRNQWGLFLAMGGISFITIAVLSLQFRRYFIWFFIAGLILYGLGLTYSLSRAALLLFLLGSFGWFIWQAPRQKIRYALIYGLPALLLAASALIQFGGPFLERLSNAPEKLTNDFRWSIYRDAMDMFVSQPLWGSGLGSFDEVFPQFREQSRFYLSIIHPESDWFWVATETGLLGAVAFACLTIALLRQVLPLSNERTDLYRKGAIVVVLIFLLHTLVDVSAHRLGTVCTAGLFFALSRSEHSRGQERSIPLWLGRLVGLILALVGLMWSLGALFDWPTHSEVFRLQKAEKFQAALESGEGNLAISHAEKWIETFPMDWQAYYSLGQAQLYFRVSAEEARSSFRRMRFLEPVLAEPAYLEGLAWIPYDPAGTLNAWREALEREIHDRKNLFHRMSDWAKQDERLATGVSILSQQSPTLRTGFLQNLRDPSFQKEMRIELEHSPRLEKLPENLRESFLRRFIKTGGAAYLMSHINNNPGLREDWWLPIAEIAASEGNYRCAAEILLKRLEPAFLPDFSEKRELDDHYADFLLQPEDLVEGVSLLQRLIRVGDPDRALRIASQLTNLTQIPDYVLYWHAWLLCELGKFEESWPVWERYLEQAGNVRSG